MENYNLKEDEVVLYKGECSLVNAHGSTQLLLTNHNIVFVTKNKKMFQEAVVNVEQYAVSDIKIYEGKPQVKTNNSIVEIYLKTKEIELEFYSKIEGHKFISAIYTLLTGKNEAERNAERVKGTIGLVNETLDVDVVKSVGNAVQNGLAGTVAGALGKIGKSLFGKKK